MDPTTILLLAMAAAGYFFFVKDDKKGDGRDGRDGHGGRHAGRGGQRPARGGWGAPPGGPGAPPGSPSGPGMPPASPRTSSGSGPLLDQLDQMIAQAMAVTDPDDAVSALKLVGQFGVSQVGPAINRQTANRSSVLTTAAAHDNAMLQAIPTSKAGWAWATTVLFPIALLPQLAASAASSVLTPATGNDKMKAAGLIHAMYEKYATALDQFGPAPAGPAAVAGYWPVAGWDPGGGRSTRRASAR